MSREKFRRTTPLLDPPVFPDLRIEEQGRTALVTVAVVLALALLPVFGQEVESVGGGRPLGRCPPASGRDLRIAPALGACALVLGVTGLDPRIDTGLAGTALSVTGRGLLPSLLCPARPAVSSVRRPRDPAGFVVARPAMGPTGGRRSVRGVGLLPLVLLLAVERGPIGQILTLQKMTEPRLLLPELDVRLEVLLAIFAPLRQVTARRVLALRVGRSGHPRGRTIIAQVLAVDPTRLRVERMTTGMVLWTQLTLTGMTLSGLSWASSGTSTSWKSLQEPHQLGARLLLHRSVGLSLPWCGRFWTTLIWLCPNFWRTRPCTGFCLCPVAVIAGTIVPPLPLFRDRTQSLPV